MTVHAYTNSAAHTYATENSFAFEPLRCAVHTFGNWTTRTAATCTAKGLEYRTCSVCSLEETREISMNPHTPGTWSVRTPATCTADGIEFTACTVCSSEITRAINAIGHNLGDWSVRTAATCTADGTEVRKCANTDCTYEETRPINATGHTLGDWSVRTSATCSAEGVEVRVCTNEGCTYEETRPITKLLHTPGEFTVKLFPTENAEGEEVKKCTVCGGELDTRAIPKLSEWVNTFTDVSDGSWYLEALRFANTMGMIKGMDDGTFSPDAKMTRGMLVTLLGRLSGVSDGDYPGEKPFTDVETNVWYAPYVAWAKTSGVVSGYPNGTFDPNKTITRQEMAKMFANYAKICDGKDITDGLDEEKYASFTDVSSVAEWAKPEMLWATSIGLINGMPDGDGFALNPEATATRAEIAQMIFNYCTKVVR